MKTYSARRQRSAVVLTGYFVITALTFWAFRHVENIMTIRQGGSSMFSFIYALSFVFLAWQTILYMLEKPYKANKEELKKIETLKVVANVPVCNEDADALLACIRSMFTQTRKIDVIHVVVNGPNKVNYDNIQKTTLKEAEKYKVLVKWDFQEVAGKRKAQSRTVKEFLAPNDIFLTVDSDAYLDNKAVEEGLLPFVKDDIMSVAGIVLTINNHKKLITRLSDLWFLTGQLVDRSAFSTMGSVLVNSGVLAFYRGHILIDNLESYTSEQFFGKNVEFSDDSMLTIYALNKGKTVQQPTSFSFTLMPENFSHHFRQQVRWMRGAFIRSWWRFKYLPLNSYAFWGHFIGWCQFFLSGVLFTYLFVWMPVINRALIPWLLIIPILVGYGQALRYLTVWRSDESFFYRVCTFLMEPIAAIWSYFVLRFVRIYAMATCLKTGWGTRTEVEVSND